MAEALLSIQGAAFAYGGVAALQGVDLDLAPGRLHGIVGPNGCGKTTLLDLMAGLRAPDRGAVLLAGRPVGEIPRRDLAREVALVPQEFITGFPFTVEETVLMGRHPHIPRFAAPREADLAAVAAALRALDLTGLAAKPVTELSGGEKQRAVVARALAQEARLMLLDEPTSHLDVRHAYAVLSLVEDLVLQEGRTAVVVLHDLHLAAAFCHRLVVMERGRVAACGPTEEVLTAETLGRVFGVEAQISRDGFAGTPVVTIRKPGRA